MLFITGDKCPQRRAEPSGAWARSLYGTAWGHLHPPAFPRDSGALDRRSTPPPALPHPLNRSGRGNQAAARQLDPESKTERRNVGHK